MRYFTQIQSLEDLKTQFRALAMQHHPDRGGDIKIMQAVNAEYDSLFSFWRNRSESKEEFANGSESRRHFYSQSGWAGERYDRNLGTKEIAGILRDYVKMAHAECKFSITREYNVINIFLVAGPWEAFTDSASEYRKNKQYMQTSHSHGHRSESVADEANMILLNVVEFLNQYRMDDSDSMTDYFCTNFYIHTAIGRWNKPFVVEKRRARRSNKVQAA